MSDDQSLAARPSIAMHARACAHCRACSDLMASELWHASVRDAMCVCVG